MRKFFTKDINSILATFQRTAADLEAHIDNKVHEHFNLKSVESELTTKIAATAEEIDRADRVLAKVKELVA